MSAQPKPANDDAPNAPATMLFFEKPAALTLERHADAGLSTNIDYGFAKAANSVPLNLIEFVPASHDYPILFTSDENPVPIVALGMEQENYFVNENGTWKENLYVPAYLRQYPFAFYQQEGDDKLYLCVDEGSDKFRKKAKKDDMKFYVDGEATEDAKNALEFCKSYFQHMQKTKEFCEDLKKYELLVPQASKATVNGKEVQLTGFQMIDEKKLNELDDDAYLALRKKGWLGFIYAVLASSHNWNRLVAQAATKQ